MSDHSSIESPLDWPRIRHLLKPGVFAALMVLAGDTRSYAGLTRHVRFIRHSDLSDGPCCWDGVSLKR